MPIYEFRCMECGRVFEHLASKSDEVPSGCPACGHAKVVRVLSAFATPKGASPACGSAASCGLGGDSAPSCASGGCCGGGPHHHH